MFEVHRVRAAGVLAAAMLLFATVAPSRAEVDAAYLSLVRDDEPVIVPGGSLPELDGRRLDDLALFRWDTASAVFVPLPFQFDERVVRVFNGGTPIQFQELMYDVERLEDERLDADDELVFLFGDAGPRAPTDAPWLAGSEARRFEIEVHDPRPGAPLTPRYAYLFSGPSLPRSPVDHVNWSVSPGNRISTPTWFIGYSDRWILDEFGVEPPCGYGTDLIDRVKGRAGANLSMESEQDWNATSIFLGGLVGPVRAIRYVRGAASGMNTVHHDVIYRGFWERFVNLRVHPIAAIALYVDLRPILGARVYTERVTDGIEADGVPDFGVGFSLVPWSVVRSGEGGYAMLYSVPSTPLIGSRRYYYRDDVNHDDATSQFYDDEDDASYGAQGVELRDLTGSATDNIPFALRVYPLCSDTGDADLGAALQEMKDQPFALQVIPQAQRLGPIRTLRGERSLADVILTWQGVPASQVYRVYRAHSPDLPRASWTPIGETSATTFVDAGAALDPSPRFYSVVAVADSQEGEW